jgi:hypothetical protein
MTAPISPSRADVDERHTALDVHHVLDHVFEMRGNETTQLPTVETTLDHDDVAAPRFVAHRCGPDSTFVPPAVTPRR